MYEQLYNGEITIETVKKSAKLWFAYVEYTEIVKIFIRAERRRDWIQHLDATEIMLNLFAVTGHIQYAKSIFLYMQLMSCLSEDYINYLLKITITPLEG